MQEQNLGGGLRPQSGKFSTKGLHAQADFGAVYYL